MYAYIHLHTHIYLYMIKRDEKENKILTLICNKVNVKLTKKDKVNDILVIRQKAKTNTKLTPSNGKLRKNNN